ncbi:hypothetical protein PVL29_015672 [Vitis rotundifolia]|uniref:Uncharacterized protein n=1 Tax=Vitis rotundifolia TaxID=103349 RepID=A0AA38ZEA6_VITRO|nr:hypothetical protein PVL29_015672 [Vitis rotundifolia]
MIVQGDPFVSKKEVLPYGILITKICQRVRVEFPINSFFLEPMGSIDTSSWNRSQEHNKGAFGFKKKVCCSKAKRKIGESDSDSTVDSNVRVQLCARFDALDEEIYAQSTLGFSLIDGQMLCNMDQLHALEDFVHKHLLAM